MNKMMRFGALSAALVLTMVAFASDRATAGQCKDPWVTQAVQQVTGREPNGSGDNGECNIYRYGGGRWSDYNDLVGKLRVAFGMGALPGLAPSASDLTNVQRNAPQLAILPTAYIRGSNIMVYQYQGRWYQVIAQGGGNVIAQGGGNVVSHDGGTVIAQGGGNFYLMKLISSDGAGLVSTNGGNVVGPGGASFTGPRQ